MTSIKERPSTLPQSARELANEAPQLRRVAREAVQANSGELREAAQTAAKHLIAPTETLADRVRHAAQVLQPALRDTAHDALAAMGRQILGYDVHPVGATASAGDAPTSGAKLEMVDVRQMPLDQQKAHIASHVRRMKEVYRDPEIETGGSILSYLKDPSYKMLEFRDASGRSIGAAHLSISETSSGKKVGHLEYLHTSNQENVPEMFARLSEAFTAEGATAFVVEASADRMAAYAALGGQLLHQDGKTHLYVQPGMGEGEKSVPYMQVAWGDLASLTAKDLADANTDYIRNRMGDSTDEQKEAALRYQQRNLKLDQPLEFKPVTGFEGRASIGL